MHHTLSSLLSCSLAGGVYMRDGCVEMTLDLLSFKRDQLPTLGQSCFLPKQPDSSACCNPFSGLHPSQLIEVMGLAHRLAQTGPTSTQVGVCFVEGSVFVTAFAHCACSCVRVSAGCCGCICVLSMHLLTCECKDCTELIQLTQSVSFVPQNTGCPPTHPRPDACTADNFTLRPVRTHAAGRA